MALYGLICTALSYSGLELVTFILVDAVVKSPLREAVTDGEKRTIWMYESFGLALICFIVYICHHMPYLLILLTSITFVYTQLVGRTGLTNILADLRAHWENHLQHEESMKQIERQKQQTFGMASFPTTDVSNFGGQNTEHGYGINFPFLAKPSSLQYPPNATVVPGQDMPTYSLNPNTGTYRDGAKHQPGLYSTYGRNWNTAANTNYSGIDTGQMLNNAPYNIAAVPLQSKDSNNRRSLWSNQSLPRRSLHSEAAGTKLPSKPLLSSSIKSKVMNVIGLGPSNLRPAGLVNYGDNLCFINSIVQCLARGPFLVENLTAIAAKELECTVFESELLSSLAELLDNLMLPSGKAHRPVPSVAKFRQACSNLYPQLVTPPGQHMKQQDAAEFLMWLLATLHGILNENRRSLHCDAASEDKFSSPRLADLKLVYGDLTSSRVHELRDQCKQDIAAANGLENESYAEAVQRLSDLEWLIYKQANDSLIDSLFTGQLVEAYYSMNYGSISVNLQTFNVLPVPIGDPTNFSGLVMLDDCFARFCNLENLAELPDKPGVRSDQQTSTHLSSGSTHRNVHARRAPNTLSNFRLAKESDMTCLPSPIHRPFPAVSATLTGPLVSHTFAVSPPRQSFTRDTNANDSGFLDNTFRTSTPVGRGNIVSQPVEHIHRRCLLRQLPECLVVQLMRFRYDPAAGLATKVSTSVSIRLRDFNLRNVIYDTVMQRSDMTAPSVGYVYELYGLCLHLGADSTSHGHYVSYCQDRGRWYRMDDDKVLEVNMEYQLNSEEVRQNAYILFYRRMASSTV